MAFIISDMVLLLLVQYLLRNKTFCIIFLKIYLHFWDRSFKLALNVMYDYVYLSVWLDLHSSKDERH